ncbi:Gibberellin receptor gid1b [Ancistrocladus abbreviatus]
MVEASLIPLPTVPSKIHFVDGLAVVVSVNYRRSPEHRYPCAYDDGWSALKWVTTRPWLQSGKDSKVHVYLAGGGSGGSIAHHVAVRAVESGVEVIGNILLHPMFGGQRRTESEMRLDGKYLVTIQDRDWYWRAYPFQKETIEIVRLATSLGLEV